MLQVPPTLPLQHRVSASPFEDTHLSLVLNQSIELNTSFPYCWATLGHFPIAAILW